MNAFHIINILMCAGLIVANAYLYMRIKDAYKLIKLWYAISLGVTAMTYIVEYVSCCWVHYVDLHDVRVTLLLIAMIGGTIISFSKAKYTMIIDLDILDILQRKE